ncbi:hypothetical protein [Planctomicrobium piriforme]|nr:hypothetical protein [Planctomicrobium piriforme]
MNHPSLGQEQQMAGTIWTQLPALPDREGFAGSFAGVSNGALVVAGGANFPERRPWEGGAKIWYDTAFVLDAPNGTWRTGMRLPRPLGYGVSVSTEKGIVCAGGSDSTQHSADVFLLTWQAGELHSQPLPSLPRPCALMCGVMAGGKLYIAGGLARPDAVETLHTFWRLDLSQPKPVWEELEPWPGPARMLATAGAIGDDVYLFSGADLKAGVDGKPERIWLKDAYRYRPGSGWQKLADLPRVAVAAPSPAVLREPSTLAIIGGDDGSQLGVDPLSHVGFPRKVQLYDTVHDRWSLGEEVPFSLVTTPSVQWQDHTVIPGGEAKPAIRSPQVWWNGP